MNKEKTDFIRVGFNGLASSLDPASKGKWGVMNAQQMIEHLAEYVRIASGKETVKALLTPEQIIKAHAFMMSEKPFRENTPNKLMSDVPPTWRNSSMELALAELANEIADFFSIYEKDPGLLVQNPFFGVLSYNEQVHLLHKHFAHHARQFGLV